MAKAVVRLKAQEEPTATTSLGLVFVLAGEITIWLPPVALVSILLEAT